MVKIMTDYAVHKMLCLRKRLYALAHDTNKLRETISPCDYREIGPLVDAISFEATMMYAKVSAAVEGYDWPSKSDRKGDKKS